MAGASCRGRYAAFRESPLSGRQVRVSRAVRRTLQSWREALHGRGSGVTTVSYSIDLARHANRLCIVNPQRLRPLTDAGSTAIADAWAARRQHLCRSAQEPMLEVNPPDQPRLTRAGCREPRQFPASTILRCRGTCARTASAARLDACADRMGHRSAVAAIRNPDLACCGADASSAALFPPQSGQMTTPIGLIKRANARKFVPEAALRVVDERKKRNRNEAYLLKLHALNDASQLRETAVEDSPMARRLADIRLRSLGRHKGG